VGRRNKENQRRPDERRRDGNRSKLSGAKEVQSSKGLIQTEKKAGRRKGQTQKGEVDFEDPTAGVSGDLASGRHLGAGHTTPMVKEDQRRNQVGCPTDRLSPAFRSQLWRI